MSDESQLRIRPSLLLPLHERHALRQYYRRGPDADTVFVPGSTSVAVNAELDLELAFLREKVSFRLPGVVREVRAAASAAGPAGATVEIRENAWRSRELLLDFAADRPTRPMTPRSRRVPVMIDVQYATAGGCHQGVTWNLSREGAAIIGTPLPERHAYIELQLRPPPRYPRIDLQAQVRWSSADVRSFGILFLFANDAEAAAVRDLLQHVSARMEAATGPELAPVTASS